MAGRRLPQDLSPKQDASDLVQECQLHAAAQFARFQGHSGPEFFAWMKGILTRRVARALRLLGRATPGSQTGDDPGPDLGRRSPSPAWPRMQPRFPSRLTRAEELSRLSQAVSWCREEDSRLDLPASV